MDKIKLNLVRKDGEIEQRNRFFAIKVKDYNSVWRTIYMHGYLVGLITGFEQQIKSKLNNNIIVIGSTGTGKSTLVKAMAGVQMAFNDKKINWDNICWNAVKFVKQYQDAERKGEALIYDEGIDSVGALNTSKEGKKVKKTVVTGRFLLRTSYFLTDELQEFAHKMVRECRALIRVTRRGLRRGYFDVYTDPNKILFIYNGLKFFNKTWRSPEIKNINPDCKGKFNDFSNIFFNEEEYDNKKLEEIKEDDNKEKDTTNQKKYERIGKMKDNKLKWKEISNFEGYSSPEGARIWFERYKKQQSTI